MHNLHPPPKIPAGMFDIANGYYDPDSGKVYTYSVRQSPVTSAHTHHLAYRQAPPSGMRFGGLLAGRRAADRRRKGAGFHYEVLSQGYEPGQGLTLLAASPARCGSALGWCALSNL